MQINPDSDQKLNVAQSADESSSKIQKAPGETPEEKLNIALNGACEMIHWVEQALSTPAA